MIELVFDDNKQSVQLEELSVEYCVLNVKKFKLEKICEMITLLFNANTLVIMMGVIYVNSFTEYKYGLAINCA
jgi:hypothetical protein